MARIGQGRLARHKADMGEDVNPSAYIVNLADCMLVLACGFLVALIARWDINLNVSEVSEDDMQEISAAVSEEDLTEAGSGYTEAGKVYMDSDGNYYIIKKNEDGSIESGSSEGSGSSSSGESGDTTSNASKATLGSTSSGSSSGSSNSSGSSAPSFGL